MLVGEVMSPKVVSIDPKTPLAQAIRIMMDHKVSGLPVVNTTGEVIGILTEGDLLRRAETETIDERPGWLTRMFDPGRMAENYVLTHARRTEEVMTLDVVTVTEETTLVDAVRLMRRHQAKRLPVVRDGKLVGIISRADVIRRLGLLLSEASASADDETIRQALLAAMERQPWASRHIARVAVANGVVQLDGCMFDSRQRTALAVLAENIPGVKRVENRIVCLEPYRGSVVYDPTSDVGGGVFV